MTVVPQNCKKTDLKISQKNPILLISRICLQCFVQDWMHIFLLLPKYNKLPQISQLKCKNYDVRLNAIIKNTKSRILVDYILYTKPTVKLFRRSNYCLKFLVLPSELLTLFHKIHLAFTWLFVRTGYVVNKHVLQLLLIISYVKWRDSKNKEARQQQLQGSCYSFHLVYC